MFRYYVIAAVICVLGFASAFALSTRDDVSALTTTVAPAPTADPQEELAQQIVNDCFYEVFDRYGRDMTGYGEKRIPDSMVEFAFTAMDDCEAARARDEGVDVSYVHTLAPDEVR